MDQLKILPSKLILFCEKFGFIGQNKFNISISQSVSWAFLRAPALTDAFADPTVADACLVDR